MGGADEELVVGSWEGEGFVVVVVVAVVFGGGGI